MADRNVSRPIDAADSRRGSHILDAMHDLVLRLGYRKVCMQDVADAAHVGKGTIYLHWRSKDELLDAILLRETDRVRTELGAALNRRPELATFGSTASLLYRGVMADPLLRAYNRGDTAVLGTRASAPGIPDRLGLSLVSTLADPRYVGLLTRHQLVVDDARSDAGRLAIGAIVGGFVLRPDDARAAGQHGTCAKLLGTVLQRSFGRPLPAQRAHYAAAVAEMVAPDGRWLPTLSTPVAVGGCEK